MVFGCFTDYHPGIRLGWSHCSDIGPPNHPKSLLKFLVPECNLEDINIKLRRCVPVVYRCLVVMTWKCGMLRYQLTLMSGRSSTLKLNVPEKDCIIFEEEMVIDKEINKEPANWVDQVEMIGETGEPMNWVDQVEKLWEAGELVVTSEWKSGGQGV